MTTEDKINLVLLAYIPINRNIIADGVVGEEAIRAIHIRRGRKDSPLCAEQNNRIILALKAGGYNSELVADGSAGEELWRAEDAFITAHAT